MSSVTHIPDSCGEKVSLSPREGLYVCDTFSGSPVNTEQVCVPTGVLGTHNLQSVEFLPCGETEDPNREQPEVKRKKVLNSRARSRALKRASGKLLLCFVESF